MPAATETVTYHMYAGPEAFVPGGKLHRYFIALGQLPPNPLLSLAFTAEDGDGVIRACSVVQSLPVVEPFTAEDGYGFTLGELFNRTRNFLVQSGAPRVLMHTEHRAMQHMLTEADAVPWHVTMFQWLAPQARATARMRALMPEQEA